MENKEIKNKTKIVALFTIIALINGWSKQHNHLNRLICLVKPISMSQSTVNFSVSFVCFPVESQVKQKSTSNVWFSTSNNRFHHGNLLSKWDNSSDEFDQFFHITIFILGSDEDYSDEASGENDGETTTIPPAEAASWTTQHLNSRHRTEAPKPDRKLFSIVLFKCLNMWSVLWWWWIKYWKKLKLFNGDPPRISIIWCSELFSLSVILFFFFAVKLINVSYIGIVQIKM